MKLDKRTTVFNFSKYASSYDQYADVQNEAAGMLAGMLPKRGVTNILEIGCGTGNYTAFLRDIFPCAKIKAIDISGPMVRLAKEKLNDERISFEVGDAEETTLNDKYDLITSNATFHWFGDLEGVIKKVEYSLAKNGVLIFSVFGPNTFSELRASLISAAGRKISIASDFFPKRTDIENILRKYFSRPEPNRERDPAPCLTPGGKKIKITERLIRVSYPSLYELLKNINYSGTAGRGAEIKKTWSPDLLKRIEGAYLARFGSIEATYQAFFCEATKCG